MMYLIRDGLFLGDITDAIETLTSLSNHNKITHVLSLLPSSSISFFDGYGSDLKIESEVIKNANVTELESNSSGKSSDSDEKLIYVVEKAGVGLKMKRMGIQISDRDSVAFWDCLDLCLDFIEEGRMNGGCVLVHCISGLSVSPYIIIAYLMRTDEKSQQEALKSLNEVCKFVCTNDGFVYQLLDFQDCDFTNFTTGYRKKKQEPVMPVVLGQFISTGRMLGSGAGGEVYEGKCNVTDELVALKKIKLDNDGEIPKSAITEAFLLSELHHENILRATKKFMHLRAGTPRLVISA